MTCIVGIKSGNRLIIVGDKLTSGGFRGTSRNSKKITRIGDTLIGVSGNYIPVKLIEELYVNWIIDNDGTLSTLNSIKDFVAYIKNNCGTTDPKTSFIVMNEHHQISIGNEGWIESMDHDILSIGSGSIFALSYLRIKGLEELNFKDLYTFVSMMDIDTGSDINVLESLIKN